MPRHTTVLPQLLRKSHRKKRLLRKTRGEIDVANLFHGVFSEIKASAKHLIVLIEMAESLISFPDSAGGNSRYTFASGNEQMKVRSGPPLCKFRASNPGKRL
jgi:hypothetical protein